MQISAKVSAGERLPIPPREELPGPDTGKFEGLDAYCQLIRECWTQLPEERPALAVVIRRLRALQQQCPGGGQQPGMDT